MVEAIATIDIIRWAIFLTFVFILLFGVVSIYWLNHLSNKTHTDVVDIDRRLRRLEEYVNAPGDSRPLERD